MSQDREPYDVSQPFDPDKLLDGFTVQERQVPVDPDSSLGRAMATPRSRLSTRTRTWSPVSETTNWPATRSARSRRRREPAPPWPARQYGESRVRAQPLAPRRPDRPAGAPLSGHLVVVRGVDVLLVAAQAVLLALGLRVAWNGDAPRDRYAGSND